MKKFEYNTLQIEAQGTWVGKIDDANFKQKLNEMGENGWELVGITAFNIGFGQTGWIICAFKREKH
jgi:hypothetical protein